MKHLLILRLFYVLSLLILNYPLSSARNQSKIDSLQNLLQNDHLHDTTRINTLNAIVRELMYSNLDTAITLGTEALRLSEKEQWEKGIANSFRNLGIFNALKGDYPMAFKHYSKALVIYEKLNDKKGIAATLGSMAPAYRHQGNYPKALDHYFKALKIDKELGNKSGTAIHLGNIGIVYLNQGELPNALNHYFKALKAFEELKDKRGTAAIYGNIGSVYNAQSNYPKALEYYFKALKMVEELGDRNRIAQNLGNIGLVFSNQADYPQALEYYFKALKMDEELGLQNSIATDLGNIGLVYAEQAVYAQNKDSVAYQELLYSKAFEYYFKALKANEEMGDKKGVAINMGNIGSIYIETGRFGEAEEYLLRSVALCNSIGSLEYTMLYEEILSHLYDTTGRYQESLKHYKLYTQTKDSIFNEEKSKDIGKLEAKHEFETAERERKRKAEEMAKQEAEQKARRDNLQYSGILIFLIVLIIGILFTGKLAIPIRLAEGAIFFTFLLLFEFLLVYLDPYLENWTGGEPAYQLAINAGLAGMIFPLHHFFESTLKRKVLRNRGAGPN